MKKLLSVLLCLSMLAGAVLAMIPAASAAVTDPERFPAMEKAELIYSENFEDDSMTNAFDSTELIELLGWSGTAFQGMEVRKDANSDNHQLYFAANADSNMTICTDDRLAGGNYTIEYTATMLTFASGSDGAGMGFRSSYKEETAGWNFLTKERGNFDFHFHTTDYAAGNRHSETDIAPEAETVDGTNRANGSIVGEKIRFRLVIDAENGLSAYVIDQNTGAATIVVGMNEECVSSWANDSATLNNSVQIRAINTLTSYLVDDIQIWNNVKTQSVPELIGYQTTSMHNETYDIRFIAGVNGIAANSMGFNVGYSFVKNGRTVSGTKTVYCEYLYEALSTDFGSGVISASSTGYNYLIALSVTDVPSDVAVTYTVTPFSTFNQTTKTGTQETYVLDRSVLEMVPKISDATPDSIKEFTPGQHRIMYSGMTLKDYNAYVANLENLGFTLYDENAINGNVYKTYTSGYMALHVYYLAKNHTITILATEKDNWTAYPTAPKRDSHVTLPSLTMMDMNYLAQTNQNFGMGFVYTLEDGSYVIIDGGLGTEAEPLYNALKANNKRADGEIVIRAWIITHPDGDHYGCFNEFTKNHVNDVTLEYFVAQFDMIHCTGNSYSTVYNTIYNNATKYVGCKKITPMAGQIMYFGTLKIEFLYTAEMYQGYAEADLTVTQTNDSSLVFKAYQDDTNVLFTGDVVGLGIDALVAYYGSALKCQYFQTPHHGLNGTKALFDAVDPEYLFINTHYEAAAQRMDSTHAHGKQSMLYYLLSVMGINANSNKIYIAGEKDDVVGDELVTVALLTPPSPTLGNFGTQKDTVSFDSLISKN